MECEVTRVIGDFPFLGVSVDDDAGPDSMRGRIERNSIALLSNFNKPPLDPPSSEWLGYCCDSERVKLWFVELESCRRKLRSRFPGRFRESRLQNGDATLIAVIQCAATKRPDAGHLVSAGGKPVLFVAHPETAPTDKARIYARPDDASDNGMTWRHVLLQYNESKQNPLGLLPAYALYSNGIYRRLTEAFGIDRFFVLSAGWGLIRADFLTPAYDIAFSQNAEDYKRRKKPDRYDDFSMLPSTDDEIVFFGSRDYVPLFCALTARAAGARRVFFNSAHRPQVEGCMFEKFETRTRTNWHYECASAFLAKHCSE